MTGLGPEIHDLFPAVAPLQFVDTRPEGGHDVRNVAIKIPQALIFSKKLFPSKQVFDLRS